MRTVLRVIAGAAVIVPLGALFVYALIESWPYLSRIHVDLWTLPLSMAAGLVGILVAIVVIRIVAKWADFVFGHSKRTQK